MKQESQMLDSMVKEQRENGDALEPEGPALIRGAVKEGTPLWALSGHWQ